MLLRWIRVSASLLCLAAGGAAWAAAGWAAAPDPAVPERWREFVRLNQQANVPGREREIFSDEKAAVRTIHEWEIPEAQATRFVSRYLTPEEKSLVVVKRGKKRYVRFFMVDAPGMPFQEMKAAFGPPAGSRLGVKLQSHNTYLVWDPKRPDADPWSIKMQFTEQTEDGPKPHNGADNAASAVRNSDAVEASLRDAPDAVGSMLPERFGAAIQKGSLSYAFSTRSMRPIRPRAAPSGSLALLPLHGALDPVRGLWPGPDRPGSERYRFITEEYLPLLARYLADLNFRRGIHVEAHTQNLLAVVDRATGRLVGFEGQDMNDAMFDPLAKSHYGETAHLEPLRTHAGSRLYRNFVEGNHFSNPGQHFVGYAFQSVGLITDDPRAVMDYTRTFLGAFKEAAERISGKEIQLRGEPLSYLERLRNPDPSLDFDSAKFLAADAAASVMQNIHGRVTRERTPVLTEESKAYDQSKLREILRAHVHSRDIAWFDGLGGTLVDSDLRYPMPAVGYAFDGKGVIAYSVTNGEVLAYAYDLGPGELAALGASPPAHCVGQALRATRAPRRR